MGELAANVMDSPKARRNLLLLAPIALFPFLVIGILFLFKDSSLKRAAADQAIYVAQTSSNVQAAIGLPIEPGWPIRGTASATSISGSAELQIPLRGSRGRGVLLERALKASGKWNLCWLEFRAGDGEITQLDVPPGYLCPAR